MKPEAIILAGGLGTRLRDAVPDLPKCMAPVAGRPFLFYVINYLRMQGVEQFVFSLGYKHELVEKYLAEEFNTLQYRVSIESEPLGTGGAIKLACSFIEREDCMVVNGDTLFKVNIQSLLNVHQQLNAACTLAVKPMTSFDRYGTVEVSPAGKIIAFREKKFVEQGLINGGIYLLNTRKFLSHSWPEKFSFETDYLETQKDQFAASVQEEYFIDIGVPADYEKAQSDLKKTKPDLKNIDKSWTIFIDRDGVINPEKKEDYIRNIEEFKFYDGVENAIRKISEKFGKVIIISNQRGVGRGLMTEGALTGIHEHLTQLIKSSGGRIDQIYYCTATENTNPNRKPNPGMAARAFAEDPAIDPDRCIMIGNKPSDMKFARNAGISSVFVATTNPEMPYPHPDIDFRFESLPDFANSL